MSDPISAAAGILALITFGVQATSSLFQTIKDFKRATSTVRQLSEELDALRTVLQSLKETIEETDSDFVDLKIPLSQCAKACQNFESLIARNAGISARAKATFQDWAKLKYHGDDINGFKETIAGYKATISIALCSVNLRSSKVTLTVFNEYKEMITNTTYDLQDRLQIIDDRLRMLVSLDSDGGGDNITAQDQMLEEKTSILKCLEICDGVSQHIDTIQHSHVNQTPSSQDGDLAPVPAVSTWLTAAQRLAGCKRQLEVRLDELRKLQHGREHSNSGPKSTDKRDLTEEINSLQKSIDICNDASREADRNRTNIFEEISMGEEGRQVIASTVGDLIFAKQIKVGSRSLQVMGQMSDVTIQQATQPGSTVDGKEGFEIPGEGFEGRHGAGRSFEKEAKKEAKK